MKFLKLLLFFTVFISCKKTKTAVNLSKITAKTIAVDSLIESSKEIDAIVAPYKEKLTADMEEVLSYTPINLVKNDGELQSSIGNLLADLCYEMANPVFKEKTNNTIDFTLFNNGGIRSTISKGDVKREDAFNVMPFENELVVVKISGDKMSELVDYFIDRKRAHPLSKNIALSIGKDDSYDLKINGKPFDKSKSYSVLTTDYLQNGGDRMNFFKNPEELTVLDYKMRDAIIDYFVKVDTLKTSIDNRAILK